MNADAASNQSAKTASPAEWEARIALAALYRLFVHFGWTDLTYTHLSARVPGEANSYLINPYGLLFDEVTASNIIKVNFAGNILSGAHSYNRAGRLIHTAILKARPEVNYILHSHTQAGAAVSAMRCGLLPISEHANVVRLTLAHHAYHTIQGSLEDCRQLTADLGKNYVMVLQNHGLLACGRTAGEAFLYHYFLQRACEIQVSLGREANAYISPAGEAISELSEWGAPRCEPWGDKQWAAMLRLVDQKYPDFRS